MFFIFCQLDSPGDKRDDPRRTMSFSYVSSCHWALPPLGIQHHPTASPTPTLQLQEASVETVDMGGGGFEGLLAKGQGSLRE